MRWFLLLVLIAACAERGVDSSSSALAHPGPWSIPAEVLAVAQTHSVPITEGGPWVGPSGCSMDFTAGAQALQDWIDAYWPQVEHIGGYSCRAINGDSTQMSVHGTGRALDIHIPTIEGEADNDLGDPLANYLLVHAQEIGIQRVIWDRWYWRAGTTPRDGYYDGAHAHHDHLHVELSVDGGAMATEWFSGPMGPPDLGVCGEAIGASGIVDDGSPCFQRFGPAMYWRDVNGVGEGGHILWTNAFESDSPSNWARWRFHVATSGRYRVEASSVADHAVHAAVRYELQTASGRTEVVIDPSGMDGWNDLGVHDFAAGEEAWVAVFDNYGPVPANQSITVDAIQLTSLDGSGDAGAPMGDGGMMLDVGPMRDGGVSGDAGRPMFDGGGGCSAGGAGSEWLLGGLLVVALRRRRAVA